MINNIKINNNDIYKKVINIQEKNAKTDQSKNNPFKTEINRKKDIIKNVNLTLNTHKSIIKIDNENNKTLKH